MVMHLLVTSLPPTCLVLQGDERVVLLNAEVSALLSALFLHFFLLLYHPFSALSALPALNTTTGSTSV